MRFPIEKYKIIIHQHPKYLGTEIIAHSTYAGKAVKGKAICRAEDNYNEEKGIYLAVLRCAQKIAKKRVTRAESQLEKAVAAHRAAKKHLDEMIEYYDDASDELEEIQKELTELTIQM